MPILAQVLCFCSFVVSMPPIRVPPLAALREVADSWRHNHPGVSPEGITLVQRQQSSQARAAWFIWQLGGRDLHPFQGCCDLCGELTASWCEGCYARCGHTPLTYSSLCTSCDRQQAVCNLCLEKKITYQIGHEAYRIQQQQGTTDAVEITIEEDWGRARPGAYFDAASCGPPFRGHSHDLWPGCRDVHWFQGPLEISRWVCFRSGDFTGSPFDAWRCFPVGSFLDFSPTWSGGPDSKGSDIGGSVSQFESGYS